MKKISMALLALLVIIVAYVYVLPRPYDEVERWTISASNVGIMWIVIGILLFMCIHPLKDFRKFHWAGKLLYFLGVGCAIVVGYDLIFSLMDYQLEWWVHYPGILFFKWRLGAVVLLICTAVCTGFVSLKKL